MVPITSKEVKVYNVSDLEDLCRRPMSERHLKGSAPWKADKPATGASPKGGRVTAKQLDCGHTVRYGECPPMAGEEVFCLRCEKGVRVLKPQRRVKQNP